MDTRWLRDDSVLEKIARARAFVSDLDGTLFAGSYVFPQTPAFVRAVHAADRRLLLLTNNSSASANEYGEKLRKAGVDVTDAEIYTSGDATIDFLRSRKNGRRVFLLGTPSLEKQFLEAGFELVKDQLPDWVVLGFDKTLTYEKIDRAAAWLRHGVPFLATHADLNCPLENGGWLVDAGAMIAIFKAATGRRPKVIGKPNRTMLQGVARRLGLPKDQIVLIGDRLTTDIRMAATFGITSVLVLSGEAKLEDVTASRWKPDLVVNHVGELLYWLSDSLF